MILMAWFLLTIGYDHKVTIVDYPDRNQCIIARWLLAGDVRDSFCLPTGPEDFPQV